MGNPIGEHAPCRCYWIVCKSWPTVAFWRTASFGEADTCQGRGNSRAARCWNQPDGTGTTLRCTTEHHLESVEPVELESLIHSHRAAPLTSTLTPTSPASTKRSALSPGASVNLASGSLYSTPAAIEVAFSSSTLTAVPAPMSSTSSWPTPQATLTVTDCPVVSLYSVPATNR